jgi:polyisoprenyl-phosphate glycosyltransferase
MVSLYFLSGLILLNLGIVGLYVGRIFIETKGRPLYVIEERLGI